MSTNFLNPFNYDEIKDRVVMRLVPIDWEPIISEELYSKPFTDEMQIVFGIYVNPEEKEDSMIVTAINWEHMQNYLDQGITEEEFYKNAERSSAKILPPKTETLENLITEIFTEESMPIPDKIEDQIANLDLESGGIPIVVLTNKMKQYGAINIVNEAIMRAFYVKFGHNFYILPSSVHEVILLPSYEKIDPRDLAKMVREINAAEVKEEDFLSNEIFYYSYEEGVIVL